MTNQNLNKLSQIVEGKTILVTGANSGIGYAIVSILSNYNCNIILVARNKEKLKKTKSDIKNKRCKAFIRSCDLSCENSVKKLTVNINKQFNGVDILINNAGKSIRRSLSDSLERLHDFRRTMELNYFGAIGLILGFLPNMQEKNKGHIINVLSMGVQFKTPGFAAYVASKAALDTASLSFAAELKNKGIKFSNVYLPLVKTPMISPTKIYKDQKAWTPEQAAELTLSSLVTGKSKATPTMGIIAEVFHTFLPETSLKLMNQYFRKEKKLERNLE
jgi:short-subunit dehydrogenase